jgi:hypothetical protein
MLPVIFLSEEDICAYELSREILKDRICEKNINMILHEAYERGRYHAEKLKKFRIEKGLNEREHILFLLNKEGIKLEEKSRTSYQEDRDYVLYSECIPKLGKIILYKDSITGRFLPQVPPDYSKFRDFDSAKHLFILHEMYHILEYKALGMTWNLMRVKCTFGPFGTKKRLRCLNEIAAHGFVREYFNIE